jgi:glutathione S-transferase
MMKLYFFPVSNTARPVRLMIAEYKLPVEDAILDFMKGEHLAPDYLKLNPNGLVPTLVDDDFVLTESSTIMKYLADKFNLANLYPKDLKKRTRVNEMMDWFNTGFYRDYGYNVVYPQIYPHHKRPSDEAQKATIEWGKDLTKKWLKTLNDVWLGKGKKFLTGDDMSIADLFGAGLLTSGHVIRNEFKDYPNVIAWLKRIEALPNWKKINEAVDGFRDYVKDQAFVNV